MSKIVKVEVPDIGDFTNVDIIEVLVAPGDQISAEDALITLESDKATIEIPSPQAGTVSGVGIDHLVRNQHKQTSHKRARPCTCCKNSTRGRQRYTRRSRRAGFRPGWLYRSFPRSRPG